MTLNFSIVKDELAAATTAQSLIDAAQLIQYVPDISDRHKLDGIVRTRLDELKTPSQPHHKG